MGDSYIFFGENVLYKFGSFSVLYAICSQLLVKYHNLCSLLTNFKFLPENLSYM